MNTTPPTEPLQWNISVPIFRNSIIRRQITLAIGIPFGILILAIALLARGTDRLYALTLIFLLFLFTFLFMLGVYGGKYDAAFTLDAQGIHCRTQPGQAKKNKIINGLTVVLGLLTGKPAVAGAGLLAGARQADSIPWKHIRKVHTMPKHHTILLRGAPLQTLAVFCTPENYQAVLDRIRAWQNR